MRDLKSSRFRRYLKASGDLAEGLQSWLYRPKSLRLTVRIVIGLDSPIATALLQEDESELRKLLENTTLDPAAFIEQGLQLAFLAVLWPAGLKMMLESKVNIDLNATFGTGDATETLLCFAGCHSKKICKLRDDDGHGICQDCPCADAFQMLMDAGCDVSINKLALSDFSARAVYTYLSHIKQWREKLEDLAMSALSDVEQTQLGFDRDSVLDFNAGETRKSLECRGIFPFERFGLTRGDSRLGLDGSSFLNNVARDFEERGMTAVLGLSPGDTRLSQSLEPDSYGWLSIYHCIWKPWIADIALDLGFRDIDASFMGSTPLMPDAYCFARPQLGLDPFSPECLNNLNYDIDYADWLVNHGANYRCKTAYMFFDYIDFSQSPFNPPPPHMVAHSLMRVLGMRIYHEYLQVDALGSPGKNLIRLFSAVDAGDGCECGCCEAEHGCLPITGLVRSVYEEWLLDPYGRPILSFADILSDMDLPEDTTLLVAKPLIRVMTFYALGIRHTCCTHFYVPKPEPYGDDFDEIREEDGSLLERLEELVAEFTGLFDQSESTLVEFLQGPWLDRIKKIVDEVYGADLTLDERKGIEAAGVHLEGPQPAQGTEWGMNDPLLGDTHSEEPYGQYGLGGERVDPEKKRREKDVGYWIREIDKVAQGDFSSWRRIDEFP